MTRRGLTMVELLLALGLLTALIFASATWIRDSALAAARGDGLRQEAAVESVLLRIQEDLWSGDFDDQDRSKVTPRVRVIGGAVEVDLRAGVTHVYRLAQSSHQTQELLREQRSHHQVVARTLLHGVIEFHCEIDSNRRWLDIKLALHRPASTEYPQLPLGIERRLRLR